MATTKKPVVKKKGVKTKAVKKTDAVKEVIVHRAIHTSAIERVITKPRITEKATGVAEGNVYTFNVAPSANKIQIKEAIIKLYKVTPRKVNIVTIKQRKVVVRGKRGTQAGGRKAYVFLKKGEKIELM